MVDQVQNDTSSSHLFNHIYLGILGLMYCITSKQVKMVIYFVILDPIFVESGERERERERVPEFWSFYDIKYSADIIGI